MTRLTAVIAATAALAALAAPALASSPAADNYVIKTTGAAEKLASDYHTMITVWGHKSSTNSQDYQAAVHFYTQVEVLRYHAAPAPAVSTPISAFGPEEELSTEIQILPDDVQLVESSLQYSFERSQLKANVNTLIQDVASYNSNLRQIWSLAGVPHPPVLR